MTQTRAEARPKIRSRFLSHGTLASKDLEATRRFYEDFLGLEVIRTSKVSLMVRLGGNHVYAVVLSPRGAPEMHHLNHNGIDVAADADVDEAYEAVLAGAEEWGLSKISKPVEQHGTYSFHFWDRDGNAWEILSNPEGGYSWIFERGDLAGKGHWDKAFRRSRPA